MSKRQRRALAVLCDLFADLARCRLEIPALRPARLVAQCEIAPRCEAPGDALHVEIVLRSAAAGYGWSPADGEMWDGKQQTFAWTCSPGGRARWIGAAPAAALRRARQ